MAEFSMDAVVAILKSKGVLNAYVEQTGGGCATIYAGPTFSGGVDEGPNSRYAACAGPGRYGWGQGESIGNTADFVVGPDVESDPDAYIEVELDWTVEQIAEQVYVQAVKGAAEQMVALIERDQQAGVIPPMTEWDGFAGLHDVCDANVQYIAEVLPVPEGEKSDEPYFGFVNDVVSAMDAMMEHRSEGATS